MPCFHKQEKKLRWNGIDMHPYCMDACKLLWFRFELINAILHKTMIQRMSMWLIIPLKRIVILYFVQQKNDVNLINIYQMQSLSYLPCILGQFTLFNFKSSIELLIFVSHTKLNGIRNDLSDDDLTVLPCTTMEIPWNMIKARNMCVNCHKLKNWGRSVWKYFFLNFLFLNELMLDGI